MIGYLLGIADNKTVLVKIDFDEKHSNINKNNIVDKDNAVYLTSDFKITKIIDEYSNKYISVDINIIVLEKFIEKKNFKINEPINNNLIQFFITKQRTLQDVYLYNIKQNGIFKQYLPNGDLVGEIPLKKGKIDGIYKSYEDNELKEECMYHNGYKNGICKTYKDNNIILTKWENGVLIK